jgi:hypothetical protein
VVAERLEIREEVETGSRKEQLWLLRLVTFHEASRVGLREKGQLATLTGVWMKG